MQFLYGEDSFRSAKKLDELKNEFFIKNTSNASSSVFDFNEKNYWEELKTAVKSRGLFSQNSLIIVKDFLNQKDNFNKAEAEIFFTDNLNSLNSTENTVIFWESKVPRKNDKLFKWFLNNTKNEEFKKLSEVQLRKWIENSFLSLGIKINSEIVTKLIANKDGDLVLISKEIEKIANFIGKDNVIDENLNKEIDKLINSNVQTNIFQTIEFISSGNKKQALKMLHQQLAQGDDPFYILSMYIYQFRNLLKIADIYFQKNTNHFDIAKEVKLHPFVVQKGIQQLRGFNLVQLKEIYKKLEKIDEAAKTGRGEIGLGLDLLIAGL